MNNPKHKKKGPAKLEVYRLLPLFNGQSMMNLVGLLISKPGAKAFQQNPTAEHWKELMQLEMETLLNMAMDQQMLDPEDLGALAERWLRHPAGLEVNTPAEFAEAAWNGGMAIDPESPAAMVMNYLQLRVEGNTEQAEAVLVQAERLSTEEKVSVKTFLRLDPLERVEMMLANMQYNPATVAA